MSVNSTSSSVLVNIVQNAVWNDGVNYALNVSGYSMFGGVQINGQDTNNIYKRIGDLTIASPSTSSIILKTNYGNWEAMRLNSAGTSINTSLYISGTTIINSAHTCTSSLNVSGITTLQGNVDCGGGIAINGSDAFFSSGQVDAGNKINTYLNLKFAGTNNDWCYLRQIGTDNVFKLAFDFHDDGNDARFCIRNVQTAGVTTDVITEVFTVDNGNVSCTGYITSGNNVWNRSSDGVYRTYYATNEISYYCCGGNSAIGHIFYNNSYANVFQIKNNGDISCTGSFTATGNVYAANFGIGIPFTPNCRLDVQGVANIRGTSPYSVPNSKMTSGSLTIGSTDTDYGYNTGFTENTAGLMMECSNITEIVVHDYNTRLASLLYYYGPTNQIYIGRDKGWGTSSVFIGGYLQCTLYSVDSVGYDKVGVADVSGTGQNTSKQLYQIWNSFTDFHRCFVDDELFNKDDPQQFKDIFMGRIVVSTGTLKTHSSKIKTSEESEWEIKTGKEAIMIEDAHPMVKLSRVKKDKRVLGVLGLNTRKNSHAERLIVNAIGEGGIWVCNSNGNIENGDYINSSNYLGYGEKQDDDLLHNYTVAKATINCDFILDSPYYNCLELNDNIKTAFISCTYHCG